MRKTDSLKAVIKKSASDSDVVRAYQILSNVYYQHNKDSSLQCVKKSIAIAKESDIDGALLHSYHQASVLYDVMGKPEKAQMMAQKIIELGTELRDTVKIIQGYYKLGDVHRSLKRMPESYKNYKKGLNLAEEAGNEKMIAFGCNKLGTYHKDADEYEEAIKYHKRYLAIAKKNDKEEAIAYAYNNIALVYKAREEYDKAIEFLKKSLKIKRKYKKTKGIAGSLINISNTYRLMGKPGKAIPYAENGIKKAIEAGDNARGFLMNGYNAAAYAHYHSGNGMKAFDHLQEYLRMYQERYNRRNLELVSEMEAKYENEKKEKKIAILNKEKKIRELELQNKQKQIKQKQTIVYAVSGGLLAAVFFSFLILRNYRQKKKALNKVEEQNKQISYQKNIIEEKNTQVTDSINYAKRIQEAVLPHREKIHEAFSGSFIFYIPRDIVSGDFYWFSEIGDRYRILATADCTGHGVPGGFMSMMGHNFLSQIVNDENVTSPGQALERLDKKLNEALNTTEDQKTQDGMDIALCAYDFKNLTVDYAGAHRPLYLLRDGQLIEYKATKSSVGGDSHRTNEKRFETRHIKLKKGDLLYTFSDGYPDQFGGVKGKKFMRKRLKEMLQSLAGEKDMQAQQARVEREFHEWKGEHEQIDDVLFIGIQI